MSSAERYWPGARPRRVSPDGSRGIEMLAVEALEDLPVDDAAGLQAQLGDSFAGPDAGRLAALLRG